MTYTVNAVHSDEISRVLVITPKGAVLVHKDGFTKKAAVAMAKHVRAHLKADGKLTPTSWSRN